MITGAQLYTIRQYIQTEPDIERSMKRIADIGYKTVQISAIGKIAPERLREICDQNGLKIVLTHTPPDRILYETDAVIKEHDILGCDYIGIGGMPDKYRMYDWVEMFGVDFREPAKKIAAAGKLFMYHNHDFEFGRFGSKNLIEHLVDMFGPDAGVHPRHLLGSGRRRRCHPVDQQAERTAARGPSQGHGHGQP